MKITLKKFSMCIFLFIFAFMFVACSSIEEKVSQNVSEYRENYYYAEKDGFKVSFTDGKREREYATDGFKTELVDYGVIVLRTNENLGEHPSFVLNIDGKTYNGTMEINPFDLTYVADIEHVAGKDKDITFSLPNSNNFTTKLNCLSSAWAVTCSRALDIFTQNKKKDVEKFFEMPAEVFIKIVASKSNENDIFFFVLCVNNLGDTLSALIDVHTGEIIQN